MTTPTSASASSASSASKSTATTPTATVGSPARLADAALTTVGYGPLFLDPPTVDDLSLWPPWVIVAVVSYLIAWYPESRLVE